MTATESYIVGEFYNAGSGGNADSVSRRAELLRAWEMVYIPMQSVVSDRTFADVSKIQRELGWRAAVTFEREVGNMLENLDYWPAAPVWAPDRIAEATADWI
jgi:UDP-glucose 4-epimerase